MKAITFTIVPAIAMLSLIAACAAEEPSNRPRQATELQAEYNAQADLSASCLTDFEDCMNTAGNAASIVACADDLGACVGNGLPPAPGGSSGGSDSGGSDSGGSGSGGSDGGGAPGSGCDAILSGCLADPLAIDPACFDEFQTCINDEVDAQLDDVCAQLTAECEANAFPGFDCASLCP